MNLEKVLGYLKLNEQSQKAGGPPLVSQRTIMEEAGVLDWREEMDRINRQMSVYDETEPTKDALGPYPMEGLPPKEEPTFSKNTFAGTFGVKLEDSADKRLGCFFLHRLEDESGVSGTGLVAVGVQFPSGHCVLEWVVPPRTMGWYERIEDVVAVHGHHGKTGVMWMRPDFNVTALGEELGVPRRGSEYTPS